jgi:hypothetical protein
MLTQLAVTILALALLMGGWLTLQAWVRRLYPELTPDSDVLDGRFGCGNCIRRGHCDHGGHEFSRPRRCPDSKPPG